MIHMSKDKEGKEYLERRHMLEHQREVDRKEELVRTTIIRRKGHEKVNR